MDAGPGFEDITYEKCTCPSWTPECVAKQRLSDQKPAEAVRLASLEPPQSCFISNMIPFIMKNNAYITSGIFPVLLHHIVSSDSSTRSKLTPWDYPNWVIPLKTAFACLNTLYTAPHSFVPAARPVIQELRSRLPKIVDVIWNDHDLLKTPGSPPDSIREAVASFFGICSADKNSKTILYGGKSLELLLTCLLEMTCPYWPTKLDFINSIDYFFNTKLTPFQMKFPIPRDILSRIFKIYPPQYIAAKFTFWLQNEELIDDALNTTLLPMVRFTHLSMEAGNTTWPRTFTASGVHIPLIRAIRRQLIYGGDPWRDSTHSSQFGLAVMTPVITSAIPYEVFTDLLSKTPFIEVTARAWYLGATSPTIPPSDMVKMDWASCLGTLRCWLKGGFTDAHKRSTPALIDAARVAIELAYAPSLFWVPKKSPLVPGPSAEWRKIFSILGITEVTIRERHKLMRKCCNIDCPHRTAGKKSEKKYTCSHCETVVYCDRTCQKADWRKHKKTCDPSSFATVDSISNLYENKI
ncbi:hypothetical protein CPB83DRAFT_849903 [Crepidotus variabilis]|uniref:MYND-type domain-containing protein n=1 Tax=Crepidotus variabilis TaxID=179855 RepID=A0A9P6EL68_9AGAR|nr:hypothetical protein CPB83DRAFT_849903 [Crepidotus variabilis]